MINATINPGSWECVWIHANIATMGEQFGENGVIYDGAVAVEDGRIVWVGSTAELPVCDGKTNVIDLNGQWVTPGLIDCHTHLVYSGDRAKEFELRLEGATYEEVAQAGGGIQSTVNATRGADEQQLFDEAAARLKVMISEGITTIEIKSGYGLETETELRMLRVARALGEKFPVDVKTTFLAAHALPKEYKERRSDYIDFVCEHMLPMAVSENLVDAVDAFCEGVGFSPEEVEQVFLKASDLKLPIKLHADQLSDLNGASLAARYNALSVDHMEYTNIDGVKAMAESGSVAVLLPGAFYFLKETQLPPITALRSSGVPIVIATDANPGSSPTHSLLLMMNMACTLFRLTPWEVWKGVTVHAAKALGLNDRGMIQVGMRADLAIWSVNSLAEVCYRIGHEGPVEVIQNGSSRLP